MVWNGKSQNNMDDLEIPPTLGNLNIKRVQLWKGWCSQGWWFGLLNYQPTHLWVGWIPMIRLMIWLNFGTNPGWCTKKVWVTMTLGLFKCAKSKLRSPQSPQVHKPPWQPSGPKVQRAKVALLATGHDRGDPVTQSVEHGFRSSSSLAVCKLENQRC